MPTITIRNLSTKVVRSLKALAQRNHRSMEQEARAILEHHTGDRLSAIAQIEGSWSRLKRSPSAREIDEWIDTGRP